jgi:hypothetical protein
MAIRQIRPVAAAGVSTYLAAKVVYDPCIRIHTGLSGSTVPVPHRLETRTRQPFQ